MHIWVCILDLSFKNNFKKPNSFDSTLYYHHLTYIGVVYLFATVHNIHIGSFVDVNQMSDVFIKDNNFEIIYLNNLKFYLHCAFKLCFRYINTGKG